MMKQARYVGTGGMKKKSKQMTWWIFAITVFLIFVFLQIPAAWLISKFYKNNQVLQNVNGNIWQGQADWHKGQLRGSVSWKTRPFDLILLRLGAQVEVHSGHTQLNGIVGYSLGQKISIQQLSGQISPETLKTLVNWQWPINNIQLKDLEMRYQKQQGFSQAEGQLQWAAGELIYQMDQRQERMNLPSLQGQLSAENGKLQLDLRDQRSQKMVNLLLDPNFMLDVQLTQRLLLNLPSYQGKAGLDTYVLSSRQPLLRGAGL